MAMKLVLAAILGLGVALVISLGGLGALALALLIWLVVPIVLGRVLSRQQVLTSAVFNAAILLGLYVFGGSMEWSTYLSRKSWIMIRQDLMGAAFGFAIAIALAQLARLTMHRKRDE